MEGRAQTGWRRARGAGAAAGAAAGGRGSRRGGPFASFHSIEQWLAEPEWNGEADEVEARAAFAAVRRAASAGRGVWASADEAAAAEAAALDEDRLAASLRSRYEAELAKARALEAALAAAESKTREELRPRLPQRLLSEEAIRAFTSVGPESKLGGNGAKEKGVDGGREPVRPGSLWTGASMRAPPSSAPARAALPSPSASSARNAAGADTSSRRSPRPASLASGRSAASNSAQSSQPLQRVLGKAEERASDEAALVSEFTVALREPEPEQELEDAPGAESKEADSGAGRRPRAAAQWFVVKRGGRELYAGLVDDARGELELVSSDEALVVESLRVAREDRPLQTPSDVARALAHCDLLSQVLPRIALQTGVSLASLWDAVANTPQAVAGSPGRTRSL